MALRAHAPPIRQLSEAEMLANHECALLAITSPDLAVDRKSTPTVQRQRRQGERQLWSVFYVCIADSVITRTE
jgi:hypothetical protein